MTLFYTLSLLFIWAEYYHMTNKHVLYNNNISKSVIDRFYFTAKFIYGIWIIIGISTPLSGYFFSLLVISLIRYPIIMTKKTKYLFIYELFNTPVSVLILIIIFLFGAI